MIPKQDIIDGLPIRWAFYRWMSGHSSHGWEFEKWRKYLLGSNERGYEKVFSMFTDPRFKSDTIHFLDYNRATTLAGFIKYWFKCCEEYEKLLNE